MSMHKHSPVFSFFPSPDMRGIRSHLAAGASLGGSHLANWHLIRRLGYAVDTPPNVFLTEARLSDPYAHVHICSPGFSFSHRRHTWD